MEWSGYNGAAPLWTKCGLEAYAGMRRKRERGRERNGVAFSNPRDRGLYLFPRALNMYYGV